MVLLDVKGLRKSYQANITVLDDIQFQAKAGEFLSVIGPSGAGKSTLLRCLNRLIEADAGDITFDSKDIRALNRKDLRKTRTDIGMVFQHYNLVPRLTVIENVLHGRFGYKSTLKGVLGIFTEEEKERAFYLLQKLGIEEHAYKRCDQLSGGQQQRVGICRALVQNPKLILCDEPIASLDPHSSKVIMDYLKLITEEMGITCIVNLHQVDVAQSYSDRVIGLNSGKLVFEGSPIQLTQSFFSDVYGMDTKELITG
ncbi:phosphonate ABC transporter ATP-binding protein [Alkalihalobacillus sp. FSL R5-0424]